MERQHLIATIKEWMRLDQEIAALRRQAKGFVDQKKELTKMLVGLMKEKSLDEIDLTDGKLVRKTRVTKSSLNKKTLQVCLSKYYKNDEEAKVVSDFILSSRTEKTSDCIVCKKEK